MPESNRDEIAKLEALYATNPAGRVFTHLAEAYRKAGEYDRARAILEQGLEKHPAYASAHVVFGRVLMDLNKSDQAVEAFRKVLQLDPHNLVALRSLGDLAREAGRNAEAMGYFEELRHLDPSNEEISGIIAALLATPGFHAAEPPEPLPELLEPQRAPAEPYPEAKPAAPAQPVPEQPVAQAPQPAEEPPVAEQSPVAQEEEQTPVFEEPVAEQAPTETFADREEPAAPEQTAEPEEPAIPAAAAPESQIEEMLAQSAEPEWTGGEIEQETLPGDLAEFARHNAPTDAEDVGTVHLKEIPEEGSIDLGPSDAVIEVKPEEAFQSIDFAEFSPAEEPTFEEVTSSETTLEPIEPEPPEYEEVAAPFEPTPEFADAMPGEPETIAEAFDVAPEPEPSSEPEPPAPSGEVVTETMADLYRSQGLNDRAAEVYRALLQQRPRDLNLKIKLQQVVAAMAAPAPTSPAPEAPAPEAPPAAQAPAPEPEAPAPFIPTAPEAAIEPEGEPEFEALTSPAEEDVHSPWTGFNQAAASAPSLYAWEEDAQNEADAGRPVSEYFRALLAWRPSTPVQSGFSEPPARSGSDILELDQPLETSQEPMFQEPVAGSEAASESMPWDQSATPRPNEPAGSQSSGEDEFDDWFSAEPPQEQQQPQQQPAASMQQSIADETAEGDEEDDDLEMFRSWLQSLKK